MDATEAAQLDAAIAEMENQIAHLVRSNDELQEFLRAAPGDTDLRDAVGENIVVMARKRAALQTLVDRRERGVFAPAGAPPPLPPAAAIPAAEAPTQAGAVPPDDGGVYL